METMTIGAQPLTTISETSTYQRAILDAVEQSRDNLIVQAAAGSGKTKTLQLICNVLPEDTRVLAVAFNKRIAQSFGAKLPPHIDSKTLHALGLSIVREACGHIPVKPKKLQGMLSDYSPELRDEIIHCMNMVRCTMTDPGNMAALRELKQDYGLEIPELYLTRISGLLDQTRQDFDAIDFTDMIDFPLIYEFPVPEYDVILVDECQDLNMQQIAFLERLAGKHARVIAVGDRNQAIYGFRGADQKAMDRIQQRFGCKELPLSVCYRCPVLVVDEARQIVGDAIEAAPRADLGYVENREPEDYKQTLRELRPGTMVLCRVNKPLVPACFTCIRRGIKAAIQGRDIGSQLGALVTRHAKKEGVHDMETLLESIGAWRDAEGKKLHHASMPTKAMNLEDRVDTIEAIAVQCETIEELKETISELFSGDVEGVIFSSIHKAKGLEKEHVVILGPELIPHPMAKTDKTRLQERNLNYVARTRAMETLVYQPLPDRDKKDRYPW